MAVVLIIWKKRVGQTLRNLAHMLASLFTLHLPGPELSLDNPESLKVPFGVAVAVAVVLYTVRQAWGVLSGMKILETSRAIPRGAEIAEAAIVLPLVFMLLLGIYWFGRAYNIYATITHAAREGARAATAPTSATFGKYGADGGPGGDPGSAGAASLQAESEPGDSPVAESGVERLHYAGAGNDVRGDWRRKPADLLPVECSDQRTDARGPPACGVSVSFQYPYQFYLPFTSLNNQLIHAQGQCADHGRKLDAAR